MDEEKKVETRDMTGWSEEEIERGETFIEGFIRSCKEAKAMRDGRLKGKTWKEFLAEMEEEDRLEQERMEQSNANRINEVLRG